METLKLKKEIRKILEDRRTFQSQGRKIAILSKSNLQLVKCWPVLMKIEKDNLKIYMEAQKTIGG